MAADIAGDVVLAELPFDQLHRREDRPLGTAGAEARRARRHHFGQRLDLRVVENEAGLGVSGARAAGCRAARRRACVSRKPLDARLINTGAVYSPPIGSTSLPDTLVWNVARGAGWCCSDCSIYSGWPSSTISTAFLLAQNAATSIVDQRVGRRSARRAARRSCRRRRQGRAAAARA